MKKLILLLAAGGFAVHAGAQDNTSMMLNALTKAPHGAQALTNQEMDAMHSFSQRFHQNAPAKKGTAVITDWYDMWNQNFTTGTSNGYYFVIFPDSNLYDNTATTPYYTPWHGLGMSFDPTDSSYFSTSHDPYLSTPVSSSISPGQNYTVDSFFAPVRYMRNDPNAALVDSLIIELVTTQSTNATGAGGLDSGAYNLQFSTPSASFYPATYDMTPRFGTIRYNPGLPSQPAPYNAAPYINDCYFDSVFTRKQRFAFALTAASVADTLSNGMLDLYKLKHGSGGGGAGLDITPMAINNSKRERIVSYVSFKYDATVPRPLGSTVGATNWIKLFAGEPAGVSTWWRQSSSGPGYAGSYQSGLVVTDQIRYNDTGFAYPAKIHDILIPAYGYSGVPGFTVTEQSFHISFTPIPSLAVAEVKQGITDVSAYPNPANNMLNIDFSLAQNASVTVSLTNMVGQVVATKNMGNVNSGKAIFSTTELSSGVYFYTVLTNSGERTTGRVVVAH
jgi:hypothetical protein